MNTTRAMYCTMYMRYIDARLAELRFELLRRKFRAKAKNQFTNKTNLNLSPLILKRYQVRVCVIHSDPAELTIRDVYGATFQLERAAISAIAQNSITKSTCSLN